MGTINLLPPELAERRRARQTAASMGIAGLALLVLLGLVFAIQDVRLRSERGRLEDQQAVNADLQRRVAALAEFERLEEQLERRRELVASLTASEVRWSVVLADISIVIPSNVWLSGFTASAQTSTTPRGEVVVGEIQLPGFTFEFRDVARWLTRLDEIEPFSFPYMSLASTTTFLGEDVIQFNTSVRLNDRALRRNQPGAERVP